MQIVKLFKKTETPQLVQVLETLPILRLVCVRQKGEKPQLRLQIPCSWAREVHAFLKQTFCVQVQGQMVFEGRLMVLQEEVTGYVQEVLFEGGGVADFNFEQALEAVGGDGLFYRPEMTGEAGAVLRDVGRVPFWPRGEDAAQLVDNLDGHQLVTIEEGVSADPLHVKQKQAPLTVVDLQVRVCWVQEGWGETDISSKLKRLWPEGVLTTLDPDSLQKRWFRSKRLGRSGYEVLKSDLTLIPEKAQIYQVGDKKVVAQAFEPHVVLGWSFKQKRQELCSLMVRAPGGDQKNGGVLKLSLGLQDVMADVQTPGWMPCFRYGVGQNVLYQGQRYICVKAHVSEENFWAQEENWHKQETTQAPLGRCDQAVYFPTERGQKSLAYAMRIAEARLKEAWLTREVRFVCALEKGMTLDEDTLVHLKDARLPGGACVGKVKMLTHVLDAGRNRFESQVVLACPAEEMPAQVYWTSAGRVSLWPNQKEMSVRFLTTPDDGPEVGPITADQLVHAVKGQNFAPEQWDQVGEKLQQTSSKRWRWVFAEVPTHVTVHLADLKRAETVSKMYDAVVGGMNVEKYGLLEGYKPLF